MCPKPSDTVIAEVKGDKENKAQGKKSADVALIEYASTTSLDSIVYATPAKPMKNG